MENPRTIVQHSLGLLRKNSDPYKLNSTQLQQALAAGRLTLERFGSSAAELKALYTAARKAEAEMTLADLRIGTETFEKSIEQLRRILHDAELTLSDIKTSESELKRLRILGCKVGAERYLSLLRAGTGPPELALKHLRRFLAEGGLTPGAIKSSEAELASFG